MMVDRRAILVGSAALTVDPTSSLFAKEIVPFFPGFRPLDVEAGGVRFAGVIGGSGAPLLLLHGYPETHIAWRKIAGDLARDFTVIAPDLPGYGESLAVLDDLRRPWT